MNKLKKFTRKLKTKYKKYITSPKYIKYYKKLPIKSDYIVLESRHGDSLDGNIYYILKELNNKSYESFKMYLLVTQKSRKTLKHFLKLKKLEKVHVVIKNTTKYYKLLASAKYLINDTGFDDFFIKKEGQIYLNTWHGSPVKCLGKSSNSDFYKLGNIQKNFYISDYLLYPNEIMMNNMLKDYMIENIYDGRVLLTGYPRNVAFFDKKSKEIIRKTLNIRNKYVIAYMPTFRNKKNVIPEVETTIDILKKIDNKLNNKQIMYVNLHPFVNKKINFSKFKHIKEFPSKYETYEFLNATDCLITDYSSVIFDYAITKNKLILYSYDEKEYLKKRGCYFKLDELPFPKVTTITSLIKEINNKKNQNYDKFIEEFCKYDNKDSSKKLCEIFLSGKKNNIEIKKAEKNNKKNILIYGGNLEKNEITSSLFKFIKNIDRKKYNVYLAYNDIKNNYNILKVLPKDVNYISIEGTINTTLLENILFRLYYKKSCPNLIKQKIFKSMKFEIKRLYGNVKFDKVIYFSDYDFGIITLFSLFECNKVIYANKLLVRKYNNKKQKYILNYAYNMYNKIIVATKDIEPFIKTLINNYNKVKIDYDLINSEECDYK